MKIPQYKTKLSGHFDAMKVRSCMRYFRNALVRANYQNLQKGIYKDLVYLERFFRNLLMGENNELMNRYLHVRAEKRVDGGTPTSTPTSIIPKNEYIKRLMGM